MNLTTGRWSLRLSIVCLAAVAVSLPIAWVSIAKLLMVLVFLAATTRRLWAKDRYALPDLRLNKGLAVVMALLFASLIWTTADCDTALQSLTKHGKLVFMLLPVLLLRNLWEAQIALRAFAVGQLILLASSWLVFAGVPLPWVIYEGGRNAVFSTYLDQSVILASSAAIFWHLRGSGLWPRWLAVLCTVAALANVVWLLDGRTGYVLAVGLVALAVAWQFPARWRPLLYGLAAVLLVASTAWAYWHAQQGQGPNILPGESRRYAYPDSGIGSDGWRLNAWHRSLQAVQQSPVIGTGAGSWKAAVLPFEGESYRVNFGPAPLGNPHQEFLLWAVEFGLIGCAALLACLLLAALDARRFDPPVARALWSLLAACLVAGMFNSVLYDDLIGDFFCIATGLLLALGVHSPNKTKIP